MKDELSKRRREGASAAHEEVLVMCRLFDDLITERLCSLRRQELSAAWECTCGPAGGRPGLARPIDLDRGTDGRSAYEEKGKDGRGGKAAA